MQAPAYEQAIAALIYRRSKREPDLRPFHWDQRTKNIVRSTLDDYRPSNWYESQSKLALYASQPRHPRHHCRCLICASLRLRSARSSVPGRSRLAGRRRTAPRRGGGFGRAGASRLSCVSPGFTESRGAAGSRLALPAALRRGAPRPPGRTGSGHAGGSAPRADSSKGTSWSRPSAVAAAPVCDSGQGPRRAGACLRRTARAVLKTRLRIG